MPRIVTTSERANPLNPSKPATSAEKVAAALLEARAAAAASGVVDLASPKVIGKLPLEKLADGANASDVLTWNGVEWASAAAGGGLSEVNLSDEDQVAGKLAFSHLADGGGSGHYLTWNGSVWASAAPALVSLASGVSGKLPRASLADGSAADQVMLWDGDSWELAAIDVPNFNFDGNTTDVTPLSVITIPISASTYVSLGVRITGEDQTNDSLLVREFSYGLVRQGSGNVALVEGDKVTTDVVPSGWAATHSETTTSTSIVLTGSANTVIWHVTVYRSIIAVG